MTTINWGDLVKNAGSFGPIPAGEYDVIVVEAKTAKTSTDKQMIKVKAKVESGPSKGSPLWTNFVISPDNENALGFFFADMEGFGIKKDYFMNLPPLNQDLGENDPSLQQIASQIMNKRAKFVVKTKQYQGMDRNEVAAVKPAGPMNASAGTGSPSPAPTPAPPGSTPTPAPKPSPGDSGDSSGTPAPAPAPKPSSAPPVPPTPPGENAF